MTEQKALIEQIEARMLNGEPFTYWDIVNEFANGFDRDFLVDMAFKKLRKAKKIKHRREYNRLVWRAVGGEQA